MKKKLPPHAQQGFALPTVLGFGFIAMMLTAALLERARSEQIGAGIQARSDLTLGLTEAGLARFRSFLDQHRQLAIRNQNQWQADLGQLQATIGTCKTPAALAEIERYARGEWQDLPDGRYRLVSYSYQPGPNGQTIGSGKITIEGSRIQFGAESRYLLESEFPIALNDVPIPALWTQQLKVSRSQKITGEVRNRSCPLPNDPDGVYGVDQENLDPTQPSAIKAATDPWLTPRTASASAIELPRITRSMTLPRKSDTPDERGNFNYRVTSDSNNNSIQLKSTAKLTINVKENQRVNLYVDGDLAIAGKIQAQPNRLRIYGSTGTKKVSIEDSAMINGIIHAPLAEGIGIAAAKSSPVGYVEGALWLAAWNSDLHNSQLPIRAVGNWSELDLPMEERIGLRLDPLSAWRRRETSSTSD
jgi:hypothetical protein